MDDNVRVTVSELRKAVISALENSSSEAGETIKKVVREVANEAYDDLRTNPIIPKKTGRYAASFKIRLKNHRDSESIEIYNTRGQVTDLLEKGHVRAVGEFAEHKYETNKKTKKRTKTKQLTGKTQTHTKSGRTRAYPHWKHAEEIANTLPDRIKEALK